MKIVESDEEERGDREVWTQVRKVNNKMKSTQRSGRKKCVNWNQKRKKAESFHLCLFNPNILPCVCGADGKRDKIPHPPNVRIRDSRSYAFGPFSHLSPPLLPLPSLPTLFTILSLSLSLSLLPSIPPHLSLLPSFVCLFVCLFVCFFLT